MSNQSKYILINKFSFYLIKNLPSFYSINLLKFAILIRDDMEIDYKKYLIARLYFLMGREKNFQKVYIEKNNKYFSWLNYWKKI